MKQKIIGRLFCNFPIISKILAVRGGFEPPVQLPVRQFSKLLVSATHPPHLDALSRCFKR